MDANTIGAAAAMEAFKQTAATGGSSNAPAGGFTAGKASGGSSSKPGRPARDEEDAEDEAAERAGSSGSGGMQDKLVGGDVGWFPAWLIWRVCRWPLQCLKRVSYLIRRTRDLVGASQRTRQKVRAV